METAVVRRPAVAGYFYPAEAEALRRAVLHLAPAGIRGKRRAIAALVPHSSFDRSGRVAAAVFAALELPECCILVAPNLSGSWMPWSLMSRGSMRTPLGDVPIDTDAAAELLRACPFLESDAWLQHGEYAAEVQLPLLQVFGPARLRIVPIVVGSSDPLQWSAAAEALEAVARKRNALLIACADLAQFAPDDAVRKHGAALSAVLARLDTDGFLDTIRERRVQTWGAAPVAVTWMAARRLGARGAAEVAFATSVEAGGDPESAVGYAGMVVHDGRWD